MCKVEFQRTLKPAPGDPRKCCRPDVVFTYDGKGVIVDTKNYENTRLRIRDVKKLVNDMCALTHTTGCWPVGGCIYLRMYTPVSDTVRQYAREHGIIIAREGQIDPAKLAVFIDRTLREGMCSLSWYQSRACLYLLFPFLTLPLQRYQSTSSLHPVSLILLSVVPVSPIQSTSSLLPVSPIQSTSSLLPVYSTQSTSSLLPGSPILLSVVPVSPHPPIIGLMQPG